MPNSQMYAAVRETGSSIRIYEKREQVAEALHNVVNRIVTGAWEKLPADRANADLHLLYDFRDVLAGKEDWEGWRAVDTVLDRTR